MKKPVIKPKAYTRSILGSALSFKITPVLKAATALVPYT